jgi:hypothetical protein
VYWRLCAGLGGAMWGGNFGLMLLMSLYILSNESANVMIILFVCLLLSFYVIIILSP